MVKHPVQVVVRTRPTSSFAADQITLEPDNQSIEIFVKKKEGSGHVNNQQERHTFKYDKVLFNVSQETMYEACAKETVQSVLQGYNGAYPLCNTLLYFSCSKDLFRRYDHGVWADWSWKDIYNGFFYAFSALLLLVTYIRILHRLAEIKTTSSEESYHERSQNFLARSVHGQTNTLLSEFRTS